MTETEPQRRDRPAGAEPERRDATRLGLVLRCGTAAAVAVIIIGTGLGLLGVPAAGRSVQRAGMMIMVGTPIAGLVALAVGYCRPGHRRYLFLITSILILTTITALMPLGAGTR